MKFQEQMRVTYLQEIEEACKALVKMTGEDIPGGLEPGKLQELKRSWEFKGYKLRQVHKGLSTVIWLDFKGEFIAGFHVELDLTLNVVRRQLLEDAGKLKELIKN